MSKADARKKRVQLRIQNKVARQAAWDADRKCTPAKQFRGLSLTETDRSNQTWWHCGLCEFTGKYNQRRRSDVKAKHLRDVHASSNISLNPLKNDVLANPARIVKTVEAFQARWQRLHSLIKDGPWPGAHCLNEEAEAAYHRSYQAQKTGKTWTRAMYLCNKCGMHVSISDFVTAACKKTGVLPPLEKRKELWKALRKQVVQRSKPEPKSRRTHPARGVRIGEAKNPGPKTRGQPVHDHMCRVWSLNVSSWRSNGAAFLEQAEKQKVQILLVQETNLSEVSSPGFSYQASRAGWHVLHVAPNCQGRKGGVAVFTREPCALIQVASSQNSGGQFLCAELIGLQRPILIGSIYRHHRESSFEIFDQVAAFLEANVDRDWILGMDANASMEHGFIPAFPDMSVAAPLLVDTPGNPSMVFGIPRGCLLSVLMNFPALVTTL